MTTGLSRPDQIAPTQRMIHAVWLGSEPNQAVLGSLHRLQELNPARRVILWRDTDLDWLENRDLYESAATFQGKSNLARYEILHRWGGLYVDCDFEWLRPLEPRWFPPDRLVAAQEGHDRYNQAIIGAPAGHPFLRRLIDRVRPSILARTEPYSVQVSGPVFFSQQLREWLAEGHDDLSPIPRDLVYPYFVDELYQRGQGPWAPEVLAVHHWQQGRDWQEALPGRKLVHDLFKKSDVRGRYRRLKGALGQRGDGVDALISWVLHGSDTYVDTAATRSRVVAAAGALALHGRVFAFNASAMVLPPDLEIERVPSVSLAGPGEVIRMSGEGPVLIDAILGYLSHIRLIVLGDARFCESELAGCQTLVTSGRVDFVLVFPPAISSGKDRSGIWDILDEWCAQGARLAALAPSGVLHRVSVGRDRRTRSFTGNPLVIDCRGLRARVLRSDRRQ